MDSKALRLIVHRLSDGQIACSVLTRSWRGAETWDRRLSPPTRRGTPPPPPPGLHPALWALLCAITSLIGAEWHIEISRAARPGPLGDDRGISAERPIPNWPIRR